MIGYGFLNSKIQEFCLSGIINSFLNRSVIYLYCVYLNYNQKTDEEKQKIIDSLYKIFIEEESRLAPRIFNNFADYKDWEIKTKPRAIGNVLIIKDGDVKTGLGGNEKDIDTNSSVAYYKDGNNKQIVEVNFDQKGDFLNKTLSEKEYDRYADLILKYILSANVVYQKDYDFVNKTQEEIISDGKNNLRKLFQKTFEEFYESPYFGVSSLKPDINIDYDSYYKSLQKYVTFPWINDFYNKIDFDESDAEEWWLAGKPGGANEFTNKLQELTNKLLFYSTDKNSSEFTKKSEINKLFLEVLDKARKLKDRGPNFLDAKSEDSVIVVPPFPEEYIVPLDDKGIPIKIIPFEDFIDGDGDFKVRNILDYIILIIDFYNKKINGVFNNGIYTSIKQYITICQNNVNPNKISVNNEIINLFDNEEITLSNLSIYFIEQNGYIDNLFVTKNSKGVEEEGILSFYKRKGLLQDRAYYLKLLTEQINSLQNEKVDEQEKYLL